MLATGRLRAQTMQCEIPNLDVPAGDYRQSNHLQPRPVTVASFVVSVCACPPVAVLQAVEHWNCAAAQHRRRHGRICRSAHCYTFAEHNSSQSHAAGSHRQPRRRRAGSQCQQRPGGNHARLGTGRSSGRPLGESYPLRRLCCPQLYESYEYRPTAARPSIAASADLGREAASRVEQIRLAAASARNACFLAQHAMDDCALTSESLLYLDNDLSLPTTSPSILQATMLVSRKPYHMPAGIGRLWYGGRWGETIMMLIVQTTDA